ncbi:MAG: outer membrane protein assembly factor BamB [Pseudomonadota bacterium]
MRRALLALGIALLVSGCGSLRFWEDEAPEGEAAEAGQESAAGDRESTEADDEPAELEDIEQRVEIERLWSVGIGDEQEAFEAALRPAVDAGTVYAASREGRVVAVDAAEGDRRWRADLDIGLTGGVGAGAGLVLVGTAAGDLVALHAENGEEAWRASLSSEILAPAAASGDLVVVQTQDAKVYGLAAADGSRRWLFEMDLPVLTLRGTATPLIVDDLVLVAFANGKLAALDADTGTPRWEARVAMPAGRTELERMVDVSTPALDGDIVYAVSYQGRVGAYTRGSGRELWARDMSSSRAPAVGRNQLYLVDTEDRVIALRATGGQELWSNPALRRRVPTAPLAIGDLVAVADGEGYLHLLSAVDGSFVGRRKVDGDGVSVPLATDGERIFVQDNSGDLSAFGVSGSVSGETGADSGK